MTAVQIIPSILVPDRKAFLRRFKIISKNARKAQLDVLDGSFLPAKSFHNSVSINRQHPSIKLEAHLMVKDVAKEILRWNYPWVEKIIFHIEAVKNPSRVIKAVKALGKKVGIAINPTTAIGRARPFLAQIDTVLVMTVNPGRNAAPFISESVKKIKQLRRISRKLNIEADGGIRPKTGRLCASAGANLLVAGSYLKNEKFKKRLAELQKFVNR